MDNETLLNTINTTGDFLGVFNSTAAPFRNGTNDNLYAPPKIPEWISNLYFSTLCLSIVLGVPGNAVTAAAYAKIKNKSNCDWYIFFVAMFDLVACTFRNTELILEYVGEWLKYSNSNYCRFVTWISQTTVCVSIFVFMLIAVDRYMKLCNISRVTITPKKSRDLSLILIVINLIIAAPCLFIFENNNGGVCTLKGNLFTSTFVIAYYSLVFVFFLIMMVVVVFCYICIAIRVRSTRRVGISKPISQSIRSEDGTEASVNSKRETETNILTPTTSGEGQFTMTVSLPSRHLQARDTVTKPVPTPSPQTTLPTSQLNSEAAPNGSDRQSTKKNIRGSPQRLKVDTNPSLSVGMSSANSILSNLAIQKQAVRQRRNVRVAGLLFSVTAVFILSWIPPYISMVKAFYIGYTYPFTVGEFVLASYARNVYIVNNFCNPVMYVIMSATYRKNVAEFFKSCKISCYKIFH